MGVADYRRYRRDLTMKFSLPFKNMSLFRGANQLGVKMFIDYKTSQ